MPPALMSADVRFVTRVMIRKFVIRTFIVTPTYVTTPVVAITLELPI